MLAAIVDRLQAYRKDTANFVDPKGTLAQSPGQKPFEWLTDTFEFFDNIPATPLGLGPLPNNANVPDVTLPGFDIDLNRPGFSFGLGDVSFNPDFKIDDVIDGFWSAAGDYLDGLEPEELPDLDKFPGFFADAFIDELDIDFDIDPPETLTEYFGWGLVLSAAGYGFDYLDGSPFSDVDFSIPGPKLDLGPFGTVRPTTGRKGGNNTGGFEWGWDFGNSGSLRILIDKAEGQEPTGTINGTLSF